MSTLLLAAALVKIAVLNLTATNVDAAVAENLTEVLVTETSALGRYQVISKSDIAAMLGFEAQKQLLNCEAEACVAEIGGALGVAKIVVGSVGKLDDVFLLNLKVIDMTTAQVQARVSEQVEGKSKELVTTIKRVVPILFAKAEGAAPPAPASPVAAAPVAPAPALPVAATEPVPPAEGSSLRWAAWGGVGLGAVAAVAGIVFNAQMGAAHERYVNAVVDSEITAARGESESNASLALTSFVVAGVAAVAGGAGLALLP